MCNEANALNAAGDRDVMAAEVQAARQAVLEAQQRLEAAENCLASEAHWLPHLRIMIVGFGNFGQFLAKQFLDLGHMVIGTGRSDCTKEAWEMGAKYTQDTQKALAYDPHVVLFCTSISSTAKVLKNFPCEKLAGKLVVDVLSVKEYPKALFLSKLPQSADILCTHPMFGPQSAKRGWLNLPFMYEKVRAASVRGNVVIDEFLNIFATAGCKMIEMSCADHDRHAAATQFITHTTGRVLAELNPKSTPIDTKGYESLLALVDSTCSDSVDLYCGLFHFNAHSMEHLDRLEAGLKKVREQLESFSCQQELEDGGAAILWSQSPVKRHKISSPERS